MESRGRILMVSTHGYVAAHPELGRPDTGGQVVYVLELSRTLARLGYQVDILTRAFDGRSDEETVAPDVRIVRVPCGGPGFIEKEHLVEHIPELVERFHRRMEREETVYRWINSHYWDAGVAGLMLAERLPVPHIHTPHSLGAWKRRQTVGDPRELEHQFNFTRRIEAEREIFERAAFVLATTQEQCEQLRGDDYALPAEKIRIESAGYDDLRFFPVSQATRSQLRRRLGFERPTVLALGRIAENKGYDLLIESMAPVVARVPDAELVLAVGATNPTPAEHRFVANLRLLARDLRLTEHIRFDDHIPDEDLADTYRAADLFVLSSRYEPFGMTAVEAMACGTPTIVSTHGGLCPELTWGRDALTVDSCDVEALGHTMVHVLKNPELAERLGRHGAETARRRYTWSAIAERLLNHVGELIPAETTATV